MKLRLFKDFSEMEHATLTLLKTHLQKASVNPFGVILPGGKTPLGVYTALTKEPVRTSESLRIILSDERQVPADSPESNYGKLRPMIHALGMSDGQVLRVHTELTLEKAASRYDGVLRRYLRTGGRIPLGLLGLGADGHTASLFNAKDILRGFGKFAIPVNRPDGLSAVSVTRDLLLHVDRIILAASGVEKGEVVHKLMDHPGSTPASMAVEDIPNVEVWYAP